MCVCACVCICVFHVVQTAKKVYLSKLHKLFDSCNGNSKCTLLRGNCISIYIIDTGPATFIFPIPTSRYRLYVFLDNFPAMHDK